MSAYRLHPDVLSDLDEIWTYIATDNMEAANRVIENILDALDGLSLTPFKGHRRSDLTSRPIRFIRAYDYLIAYDPGEKPLVVLAVLHGRRNPRIMAAVLRRRG